MTPKPTHELFLERMAHSGRRHPLAHPCAQSCSGYSQGVDDGAYGQSARTEPITKAVGKLIEAVGDCPDTPENKDLKFMLANLRRVLDKGER